LCPPRSTESLTCIFAVTTGTVREPSDTIWAHEARVEDGLTGLDRPQLGALPSGLDAPNTVFTQHLVYEIGLKTSTSGWLIQSAQPLIAAQIHNAQAAAAAAARLALAGRSSCGMADGSSHILLPLRLRRARLNQRSPASGGFSARH